MSTSSSTSSRRMRWVSEWRQALVRGPLARRAVPPPRGRRRLAQVPPRPWHRNWPRQGIEVVPALPVNPVRRLFARLDLRNHRKLAVIDGRIAYTGSQNVVRPDYGKKGVGEWRDLMVRLVGPSVSQLQAVFLEDWEFETGELHRRSRILSSRRGSRGRWPSRSSPAGRTTRRASSGTWSWRPCMRPVAGCRHHHALLRPRRSPPGCPPAGGRPGCPGGPDRPGAERPAPGGPRRAVLR